MPPPKLKLYKTGKPQALSKPPTIAVQSQATGSTTSNTISDLDSENVRQFELELAWCIQTMESSLNGGKLNGSQVQDATKTLKLLKSSNQAIIRKRQLMRSSFGDYRAKKAEEEKKLRIGRRQIQFSNQPNSKSFFVKRSVLSTIGKDKDFKFDLPATTEQLIGNLNLNDTKDKNTTQKSLTYSDSSKRIDREMLASSDIEYFKPIDERLESPTGQSFHNSVYGQILVNLKTKLSHSKFSTEESDGAGKNLLRISISALGSPLWYDDDFLEYVCLFLYCLKALVRTSLSVACITVPSHLFKHLDDGLIHRIRNLVDYSVELESFAGSDKETNPIFKDYHCLLYIRKLAAVNSLAAYTPVTSDLVFKLKRKSFVIEKLHLPPELQEIDAKPDAIPSMSCGSSTKKLLDF